MASREWVRFNDDARAAFNREQHVKQNGGSFVKNDQPPYGLKWQAEEKKTSTTAKKKGKKK